MIEQEIIDLKNELKDTYEKIKNTDELICELRQKIKDNDLSFSDYSYRKIRNMNLTKSRCNDNKKIIKKKIIASYNKLLKDIHEKERERVLKFHNNIAYIYDEIDFYTDKQRYAE